MRDPTRTLTLRNMASREIGRRFGRIKSVIKETIENANITTNATAASPQRFVFLRDPDKVVEFEHWLNEQINTDILARGSDGRHWLNVYIGTAYQRGAKKSQNAIRRLRPNGFISDTDIFNNPVHVQRAQLIYTRVFSALRGVTQTMSSQMSAVLSSGILQGDSVAQISRNLNDRVDKIGIVRSRLISRTEIVNAHNVAAINETEYAEGILDEQINMEWLATLDDRLRHSHSLRNGVIYSKEQSSLLIGEPNCRCAVIPVFEEITA